MSAGEPGNPLPEGLARRVVELSDEAVCVVDARQADRPIVWVNSAFERMTGFAADEVLGRNPRFLQGGDTDQPGIAELREALAAGRPASVTLRNYRADGSMFWNALRVDAVEADGGAWWVGFSRDVTAERRLAAELGRAGKELEGTRDRLALVDPLDRVTGLINARRFDAELERSWFVCAREGQALALFAFSPDFFDIYGETFGRTASESSLRMMGRAIAGCFRRASDLVGRTGDLEFGAVATGMDAAQAEAHARRVFERIRGLAMHNPRAPAGRYLTLSAGIALGRPGPEGSWEELLGAARGALEHSQGEGWERVRIVTLEPRTP